MQRFKLISIIVCGILLLALIASLIYIATHRAGGSSTSTVDRLNKITNPLFRAPRLAPGGDVNVYGSASMFCLADYLYAVGPGGIRGNTTTFKGNWSMIAGAAVICFGDTEIKELKELCEEQFVPWFGLVGECKKIGYYTYTPQRDGIDNNIMSTALAIAGYTAKDYEEKYVNGLVGSPIENIACTWNESIFNTGVPEIQNESLKLVKSTYPPDTFVLHTHAPAYWNSWNEIVNPKTGKEYDNFRDLPDTYRAIVYNSFINTAIGITVGANDLFNMFANCNTCIFNMNGIAPDSGAMAEMGQLGSRGIPIVILKGQQTADFAGASNPMPLMASSTNGFSSPTLRDSRKAIFYNPTKKTTMYNNIPGALDHLKERVDKLYKHYGSSDPMAISDYNTDVPLPPLLNFWVEVGARAFFLKHKAKLIESDENGLLDKSSMSPFWVENMTGKVNNKNILKVAKTFGDNLAYLNRDPSYKHVNDYWY